MPTTVAIVEDDAGICEDLAKMIGEASDLFCACTCRNGRGALHKIPQCVPDVIIMDIQLPDMSGIECTAKLRRLVPKAQILMFTVRDDEDQVFRALEAGASGYLLKGADPAELLKAVREISRGGSPMTGEISRKVVRSFQKDGAGEPEGETFTSREKEVLNLLVEGRGSKEIADRLFISLQTVNFHLKQIYQKMQVHSRTEAVVKYLKRSRRG